MKIEFHLQPPNAGVLQAIEHGLDHPGFDHFSSITRSDFHRKVLNHFHTRYPISLLIMHLDPEELKSRHDDLTELLDMLEKTPMHQTVRRLFYMDIISQISKKNTLENKHVIERLSHGL